ncbi:MAG: hypothetical protein AAGJ80_05110, partial [Cyanobacteria bacterium J06553_1]
KPNNINNKRRKSRASPPKPTSAATSTSNTNINAAKESFFNQRNAFQSLQDTQRVAPIDYQQECGLHCASRGPHSHAQDVNTSGNPRQNPTTAPLNPNQHHQRRVLDGEVADDMLVVLSEEASLRKQMMAQKQAKEARPAKKFVEEGSLAFRGVLQRFQAAVNIPGLSAKLKMIELPFWFGGVADQLIASYATFEDAESAFDDVIAELSFLFGGNSDSIAPLINQVKSGKQIPENDHKGHISFYSELLSLESQARAMVQLHQLSNIDTLAEIMETRLKYAASKWWNEDLKRQQDGSRRQSFNDLKKLVQDAIYILGSRKALAVPPAVTKTNATDARMESSQPQTQQQQAQGQQGQQQQLSRRQLKQQRLQQRQDQMQQQYHQQQQHLQQHQQQQQQPQQPLRSYVMAITDSPPKEQQKCVFCEGPHASEVCNKMWSADMETRLATAREKKVCLKCLKPGHLGRDCPEPATCTICKRPGHHAMFHGRPFKKPGQQQSMSVNAMSFIPALPQPQFNPSQSAANATAPLIPTAPALSNRIPTALDSANSTGSLL